MLLINELNAFKAEGRWNLIGSKSDYSRTLPNSLLKIKLLVLALRVTQYMKSAKGSSIKELAVLGNLFAPYPKNYFP